MRRWLLPVSFLLVALALVGWLQWVQGRSRSGFPAPDFTLPDLEGRLHSLSSLRGSVVFLNLWATWCPPCRTEMPSMEELHRRLKDKGLVVLAVSEDTDVAAVAAFARELGLSFPVLLDPDGRLPPRYGITGYPETFIIDREGNVLKHHVGPADWASPESLRYFTALLEQPAQQAASGS